MTPSATHQQQGDPEVQCSCGAELVLPEELRHGSCIDCRLYCDVCGELVGVFHADGSRTLCDGCEAAGDRP
jgi:hypothetical protein